MKKILWMLILTFILAVIPSFGADILGDSNNDSTIDIVDGLLTAQFYVGLDPQGFVPGNSDVDARDGRQAQIHQCRVEGIFAGQVQPLGPITGDVALIAVACQACGDLPPQRRFVLNDQDAHGGRLSARCRGRKRCAPRRRGSAP